MTKINVEGKRLVREKKIAKIDETASQAEVDAIENEIDDRVYEFIDATGFDTSKYVMDGEKYDITGMLNTCCLLKTTNVSDTFFNAFPGQKRAKTENSEFDAMFYGKGAFLLVDDSNAADVKYTIVLTKNVNIKLDNAITGYGKQLFTKVGNNDYAVSLARVWKFTGGISNAQNQYIGNKLKAYGADIVEGSFRVVALNRTINGNVSNISSEFTKVPEQQTYIKINYTLSNSNQTNYQIPAPGTTDGTYTLKATVADGKVTGFNWVADQE